MKLDLEELKRLHDATTKGPWALIPLLNVPASQGGEPYCLRVSEKGPRFVMVDRSESLCAADGEWIAAIHNAFPAILAKLESDQAALNEAAYALFQIKRMAPEAVPQFASDAHAKACKHLDNFPTFDKEQTDETT